MSVIIIVANTTVHITDVNMKTWSPCCIEENESCRLIVPNGPRPISDEGIISCVVSRLHPMIESIHPLMLSQSLLAIFLPHLSVSPMQGSNDPIIAGMSATLYPIIHFDA